MLLGLAVAAPVAGQQAAATCGVAPIVPAPAMHMTQRLNDNLACLARRVEQLELELRRRGPAPGLAAPGLAARAERFVDSGLAINAEAARLHR